MFRTLEWWGREEIVSWPSCLRRKWDPQYKSFCVFAILFDSGCHVTLSSSVQFEGKTSKFSCVEILTKDRIVCESIIQYCAWSKLNTLGQSGEKMSASLLLYRGTKVFRTSSSRNHTQKCWPEGIKGNGSAKKNPDELAQPGPYFRMSRGKQ